MNEYPDLQKTIRALADKSRMEILTALIDGKFHTVSELAKKSKDKESYCYLSFKNFVRIKLGVFL